MATAMEKLIYQIVERKKTVISDARKQVEQFDRYLASKCMLEGVAPPPWLCPTLDPHAQFSKEDFIGVLLHPTYSANPGLPCSLKRGTAVAQSLGVELSSADICNLGKSVSPVNPATNLECGGAVPASPKECGDVLVASNADSLLRLQRSKSRQKALKLRSSAKAAKQCSRSNQIVISSDRIAEFQTNTSQQIHSCESGLLDLIGRTEKKFSVKKADLCESPGIERRRAEIVTTKVLMEVNQMPNYLFKDINSCTSLASSECCDKSLIGSSSLSNDRVESENRLCSDQHVEQPSDVAYNSESKHWSIDLNKSCRPRLEMTDFKVSGFGSNSLFHELKESKSSLNTMSVEDSIEGTKVSAPCKNLSDAGEQLYTRLDQQVGNGNHMFEKSVAQRADYGAIRTITATDSNSMVKNGFVFFSGPESYSQAEVSISRPCSSCEMTTNSKKIECDILERNEVIFSRDESPASNNLDSKSRGLSELVEKSCANEKLLSLENKSLTQEKNGVEEDINDSLHSSFSQPDLTCTNKTHTNDLEPLHRDNMIQTSVGYVKELHHASISAAEHPHCPPNANVISSQEIMFDGNNSSSSLYGQHEEPQEKGIMIPSSKSCSVYIGIPQSFDSKLQESTSGYYSDDFQLKVVSPDQTVSKIDSVVLERLYMPDYSKTPQSDISYAYGNVENFDGMLSSKLDSNLDATATGHSDLTEVTGSDVLDVPFPYFDPCVDSLKLPYSPPVKNIWDGMILKSGSSCRFDKSTSELPCISEEMEDADGIIDTGKSSEALDMAAERSPLVDITTSSNVLNKELAFDRVSDAVEDVKARYDTEGKKRRIVRDESQVSVSLSVKKNSKTSLQRKISSHRLSQNTKLRKGGSSASNLEFKHRKMTSNYSLTRQTQKPSVASGKREVKVKALEAAIAAKLAAEKKEQERKIKKDALKLERERKEEAKKQKEIDAAARKRQREQEDRKEKETKRKCVEKVAKKHDERTSDLLGQNEKLSKKETNPKLHLSSESSPVDKQKVATVLRDSATGIQPSYEISPYKDSDDENEDEAELNAPTSKHIPRWASETAVALCVAAQARVDPDAVFPARRSSSLDRVLPRKQQKFADGNQQTTASVR